MNHQTNRFIMGVIFVTLLLNITISAQQAPAGALIKNQASATYKDASGVEQYTTSNMVETLIQQVGSLELLQDQNRQGIPNKTVLFSHVLINTGNAADTYQLTATNVTSADDFDFTSIQIFADENKDGEPDSITPITETPSLNAEEEFYFIVEAELPSSAVVGEAAKLNIVATSDFDNTASQTNIDTVIATDKAVIDIVKSMNILGGASPSGAYTVTLAYKNNGLQAANNVLIIDALPIGMNYVDNSARWSGIDATTVLTDNDPADTQGTGNTIIFCAYDASCTGLSEATSNIGNGSTEQVTAILSSIPAGGSGELTFDVMIASDLQAAMLYNKGEYEYNDSVNNIARLTTNRVPFTIHSQLGVIANGSSTDNTDGIDNKGGTTDSVIIDSAMQGEVIFFDNYIWNTGNSTDTFDITLDKVNASFPVGTVFFIQNSDSATPLMDSNNNGYPDTGPMVAGAVEKIVVRAVLPQNISGDNNGSGFEIELTASSISDSDIVNTVIDRIATIVAAEVDLMNDTVNAGLGAGAETVAVNTYSVIPGKSTLIPLYINNNSGMADGYLLQFSDTNGPFTEGSLPTGWQVNFYLDSGNNDCSVIGNIVTSTGVVAANTSRLICADVSIPSDADASPVAISSSIYFKVLSNATGSSDTIHDAIRIASITDMTLEPSHNSQTEPSIPVTYTHVLTNQGNVALECVTVTATHSQSDWQSIIYLDSNGDGIHDSSDPVIDSLTLLKGASNTLFVKVFSPANGSLGIQNVTKITASGQVDDGVAGCSGAVETSTIEDVTLLSNSFLSIYKEQAVDAACDGVADSAFSTNLFSVNPKECVIYRLSSMNNSTKVAKNVRIDDAAPEFTTFYHAGSLPKSNLGNITGGADGDEGKISAGSVNGATVTLQPGEVLEVIFGVRLD